MTQSPPAQEFLRALIVDDEPPARARLRRLVEELPGAAVAGEAANGREALELCARLEPDVVLLDVRMPGMDGIEVARHLAALEDPPAVIFTTAYDEYAVEAFEAQAVGYLLKPVRREKLESALHRAAMNRSARASASSSASYRWPTCTISWRARSTSPCGTAAGAT
jgi:two-component system response regulator AlgR